MSEICKLDFFEGTSVVPEDNGVPWSANRHPTPTVQEIAKTCTVDDPKDAATRSICNVQLPVPWFAIRALCQHIAELPS